MDLLPAVQRLQRCRAQLEPGLTAGSSRIICLHTNDCAGNLDARSPCGVCDSDQYGRWRLRFGNAIAVVGKYLLIAPLLCANGLRINHDAGATCQFGSATMICCSSSTCSTILS